MASLNMALGLAATKSRVFVTKASKSDRGSTKEEKGLFDWIMAGMQKDQLLETDPVLQRAEDDKSPSKTTKTTGTGSVSIPNKKKFGGFGGLFAKN
ncbi:uncharacterized protein M6B38_164275 [Iris pallida]|uniref:Thylakoid soluble phosphoprotein TSP9 n=1 Tax=Iris pallida TaxID=29817 RepID=A0AAX6EYC8_IRIPA|nr:uncharacterized protein M6B38_164275 [Iris pallida]